MAQRKLPIGHRLSLMVMSGLGLLQGCPAEDAPIGMTLVYECEGPKIYVSRFEAEGMRNAPPGVVGCGPQGGAEMAFMPGDSQGKMPRYVDVSWSLESRESEQEGKNLMVRPDKYRSEQWFKDQRAYQAKLPKLDSRIYLDKVVPAELIATVRANAQTTQLRLIMTFRGDRLDVKATAHKWR